MSSHRPTTPNDVDHARRRRRVLLSLATAAVAVGIGLTTLFHGMAAAAADTSVPVDQVAGLAVVQ